MSGPGEGSGIGPGARKRRKNQTNDGFGPFGAGDPSFYVCPLINSGRVVPRNSVAKKSSISASVQILVNRLASGQTKECEYMSS